MLLYPSGQDHIQEQNQLVGGWQRIFLGIVGVLHARPYVREVKTC